MKKPTNANEFVEEFLSLGNIGNALQRKQKAISLLKRIRKQLKREKKTRDRRSELLVYYSNAS